MDYTVRNRDTLASIARRFHTTADAIARQNHLRNPDAIRPGQRLQVPGDRDEFTPARTTAPVVIHAEDRFCPAPRPGMSVMPGVAGGFRPGWESLIAPSGFGADPATNDRHVTVPYYLQTEAGHGFTPGSEACFDAASQMATDAGGTVRGPYESTWIGRREDRQGRLTVLRPGKVAEGVARIDAELDANRPIVVGVSHSDHNYNVDHITDHFVTITGRGTDTDGSTYYTFHDPGVRGGDDTNPRNRLYVDAATGNLYRPENPLGGRELEDRRYEMSMVR